MSALIRSVMSAISLLEFALGTHAEFLPLSPDVHGGPSTSGGSGSGSKWGTN